MRLDECKVELSEHSLTLHTIQASLATRQPSRESLNGGGLNTSTASSYLANNHHCFHDQQQLQRQQQHQSMSELNVLGVGMSTLTGGGGASEPHMVRAVSVQRELILNQMLKIQDEVSGRNKYVQYHVLQQVCLVCLNTICLNKFL